MNCRQACQHEICQTKACMLMHLILHTALWNAEGVGTPGSCCQNNRGWQRDLWKARLATESDWNVATRCACDGSQGFDLKQDQLCASLEWNRCKRQNWAKKREKERESERGRHRERERNKGRGAETTLETRLVASSIILWCFFERWQTSLALATNFSLQVSPALRHDCAS